MVVKQANTQLLVVRNNDQKMFQQVGTVFQRKKGS